MNGISSYAIKVTAIHHYNQTNGYQWDDKHLVDRILDTLDLLRSYLRSSSGIPCLWDGKNDLLHDMNQATRNLQANYLTTAINSLRENTSGLKCESVWSKYFPTNEE